jgi:pimeloyl-ACP methyl ester carboxylesterase
VSGLVIFLHGLTGDRHTWGAVPDFIQNSPLGSDFAIATPEYSGSIRSRSDLETSTRRILTEIETRFAEHDPIFLVGHSLGGLVARDLCRRLLESGPDALLNKIPAVITAGTPLEGARFGNWLLRYIPLVSPKIHQLSTRRLAFDDYRMAIRAAKERAVRRPKQLHVVMEDDAVIARHVKGNFTEDDHDAAVIPGTHTHFADKREDASYVADVLLTLIRNEQNSLGRPYISPPAPASIDLPDRLILIACSHSKRDGGGNLRGPGPASWIPQRGLRQRVISKRSYVYSVLKDAKLADGFERGGNRAHQPANRPLKHGPDLGGNTVVGEEGLYVPAWERYSGRIYSQITKDSWKTYIKTCDRMQVLIMSGLYGLLDPKECIQNYDVHLTDTHIESGASISSTWLELYTECLQTYVQHSYRNRKVKIFNFLCDRHYVDAVRWHSLPGECSVYHLASRTVQDVDLLPPAGTILDAILRDPDRLEEFEREDAGTEYEVSAFGQPPPGLADMRFSFESRVGISLRMNGEGANLAKSK